MLNPLQISCNRTSFIHKIEIWDKNISLVLATKITTDGGDFLELVFPRPCQLETRNEK